MQPVKDRTVCHRLQLISNGTGDCPEPDIKDVQDTLLDTLLNPLLDTLLNPFFYPRSFDARYIRHLFFLLVSKQIFPEFGFKVLGQDQHPVDKPEKLDNVGPRIPLSV